MGVKTTTTVEYECDICGAEIPESQSFAAAETTLWSDRDVTARLAVAMVMTIDYVTDKGVVCKRCAARELRRIADKAEKEVSQ